ncbi:sensor histidine kinase [Flavilitoribacter nigricans]|nr:HAMP domain-containing sensor histidine kinase [Flavilitoribacter nigricans]
MYKRKKDWLPVGLMLFGLVLLLAFQAVWLERTYRTEKSQFTRRAGELLEIAVRELYDAQTIDRLRDEVGLADSCELRVNLDHAPLNPTINFSTRILKKRVLGADHFMHVETDSLPGLPGLGFDTGRMIVISQVDEVISEGPSSSMLTMSDSSASGIRNLFARADRAPMGMQILFGLANDSLSVDTVQTLYTAKLKQEDMLLPFALHSEEMVPASGLATRAVSANMFGSQEFMAVFPNYRAFVLGQMWEEALFSLLLFGVIALAFALIYRSLRKQHRLSLLKNELLSNITHELKTPISSVSVAIEALRDFGALQDPALTREYLDISRDELKRLSLLVDRVLRLTTFEQKEPDLQLETLDMSEVTRTILRTMQVQFDQYDARHELKVSGRDFSIQGDRTHLSSVLFNLLDNALKYRNGQQPEVKLHLEAEPDWLRISVQDNGMGIPAAYQERIFEKFFRVPQGNVHNAKGYGLGLSYVAAVVAKHGGRVEVHSKPGNGSRFTLTFPKN